MAGRERRVGVGSRPAREAEAPRVDPVNIAHRGASAYAPEHTLAAYSLAIELGADFVEQDLQLTRDNVLICMHDTSLNRTTNVDVVFPDRAVEETTPTGRRRVWRVADFTLAEIKTLDVGSWFGARFTGATVPTWEEAIELVQGRAGLYPETKAPEEYEARGFTMEAELLRVLAAHGLDTPAGQTRTPIFVQSFSAQSLRRIRAIADDRYPLIQLVDYAQEAHLSPGGLLEVASYAAGVGPAIALLVADPTRGAAARRLGLEVHPYTVRASQVPDGYRDATGYMRYLVDELGATGVFTDNPDSFPRG